jgi:hypothetical protein
MTTIGIRWVGQRVVCRGFGEKPVGSGRQRLVSVRANPWDRTEETGCAGASFVMSPFTNTNEGYGQFWSVGHGQFGHHVTRR